MATTEQLFMSADKITRSDILSHHYILNAVRNRLPNYRLLTIGNIVSKGWRKDKDIPKYIMDFVGERGRVIAIANIVNRKVPQLILRDMKEKKFSVMGRQSCFPYGLGQLSSDFKYGDWIVIVEGQLDRDSIVDLYPNVIATLTAGLSVIQTEILKHLTNRVILMYDNDDVGLKAISRDRRKLLGLGMDVKFIKHPNGVKDSGTIAELYYKGKTFDMENLQMFYKSAINSFVLS